MFRAILLTLLLLPTLTFAQSEDCPVIRQVSVTIQTSPFPSLPGQAARISVFVNPVQGIAEPSGDVQISDGVTDLGTATLKQGQTSLTRTFSESGAHMLRAYYVGDFNYCWATGNLGHQVDHLTPTITLAASGASPVTLTATIAPDPPSGVAAPAGPVQFLEGATVLGVAVPKDGKAALALPSLAGGTHQIVAVLTGDAVWYSVRSAPVTVTVKRNATTTTLAANAGVQQTTLTATVASDSGTPTGSVGFLDSARNVALGSATLSAAGTASITLTAAQIRLALGHEIVAVYSGADTFTGSSSSAISVPVAINATGAPGSAAPEQIVSLYGLRLADSTVAASALPLPDTLGGLRVTVTDSAAVARNAGLYFVSASQINFVMPAATAPGTALIAVVGPAGRAPVTPVRVDVAPVAPGIFTTGDATGLPAAQVLRVRADGTQSTEAVTAAGIRIGVDTVYLVLYGTGIRNRSALAAVTSTIGGVPAPVVYAGPQAESPGLDQVNIELPAALAGKSEVTLVLSVDGQAANAVAFKLL